ncbi:choline transporter-like protein 4 [Amphiura filiformis]|uniref:choline transporter-like protein 4 n=1 Tax=Amphiura filiformis TaxID=82378 RepID=UPI003B21A0AB
MGKKKERKRSDSNGSNASHMERKYGIPKSHDPNFKGPIRNRSCTDVPCCILFATFLTGVVLIACFAFTRGNPHTIIYPSDYKGNICNMSQEVKNKPYSLYFDYLDCLSLSVVLTLSCPTPQVCLKTCPQETFTIYTRYPLQVYQRPPVGGVNWEDFICLYGVDPEYEVNVKGRKIVDLLMHKECAAYYVSSIPIGGRCMPTFLTFAESGLNGTSPNGRNITEENISALGKILQIFMESEQIANLVDDFHKTWPYLVIGMVIAMLGSFFLLMLLQWIASVIVWGTIAALIGIFTWGIYYTFDKWRCYDIPREECVPSEVQSMEFNLLNVDSYLRISNVWLGFFITLCVLAAIVLLLVFILFTRIRIATALIEEASQALGMMLSTLFWPIIPFTLQLAFISFWAFVAVYLASSGQTKYIVVNAPDDSDFENGTFCDIMQWNSNSNFPALCEFETFGLPEYTIYLQLYMVVALYWVTNFIIALGEMTLAGAYASYYWAREKPKDIPMLPVIASLWRSVAFHLGSLAFGSFIIAVIQIIRTLLEYVEEKVQAKSNPITRFIFCCCKCFFWCLEKFMRFINRNAYIEIAVYGYNFCSAAKNAFFLLMRNILRVAVLNSITSFILFIFKLTISLGMSIGAFYFFSWSSSSENQFFGLADVHYLWVPILVVGLSSYVIAAAFFGVYDMGVDTLFLCFLEDLERHDGSEEKPYFMAKSLRNILHKKNKPHKNEEQKKSKKKKGKNKSGEDAAWV